ncbi:protein translocase subunit SecD [Prochlorococcus sp. MIT 1300]|uniref:protein translocase subunit SecD n=1 Tax=Prochlorococcus sp. MIT 1300 TaxID=3096218 RepID=UPI002A75F86B|nr:protein translocase subunit SecD [Prochlorococcus sp. MIT 1300]
MARQQGWFAIILFLALFAGAVCFRYPFQLGLDLKGGSQLTLEVQPTEEILSVTSEQLEAVKLVLDRRVNGLGVAESTLQTIGDNQLILQLPGEQDPTRAEKILGETALLEFRPQKVGKTEEIRGLQVFRANIRKIISLKADRTRDLDEREKSIKQILTNEQFISQQRLLGVEVQMDGSEDLLESTLNSINEAIANCFEPAFLTGKDLISAGRQQQQNVSSWEVTLSFNSEGGEKFAELTQQIAGTGRLLGIVLDGRSISEATVGEQFKAAGITGGAATISGNFTAEEARVLEVQLRGGSLPLPVRIQEVRTIGPGLGAENIRRSLIAALSGLALVAVFMLVIYRLAGFVAVIALSLYAVFNLAFYKLIPVTLTLPGIAGFILSIGMAVDANVLIFERVKDELRRGNTLIRSIEKGFLQAFSSIIDGHLTTLISCSALFFLGTGFVKGFAATLGIGVLLSLFTALSCTRTLLRFLMGYQVLRKATNFLPAKQLPSAFP